MTSVRDITVLTLEVLNERSGDLVASDLVASAMMNCDLARQAVEALPSRAMTPEQIERFGNAVAICRKARLAVGKALPGNDAQERLLRRCIVQIWRALETDLFVRQKEQRLAEIERQAA